MVKKEKKTGTRVWVLLAAASQEHADSRRDETSRVISSGGVRAEYMTVVSPVSTANGAATAWAGAGKIPYDYTGPVLVLPPGVTLAAGQIVALLEKYEQTESVYFLSNDLEFIEGLMQWLALGLPWVDFEGAALVPASIARSRGGLAAGPWVRNLLWKGVVVFRVRVLSGESSRYMADQIAVEDKKSLFNFDAKKEKIKSSLQKILNRLTGLFHTSAGKKIMVLAGVGAGLMFLGSVVFGRAHPFLALLSFNLGFISFAWATGRN